MKQTLVLLVLSALFLGCGGEEQKSVKKSSSSESEPTLSDAEVCEKALACIDGLVTADRERARSYERARETIAGLEGAPKVKQCKGVLEGAGYNKNAPAVCK